jgi:hypothetical protein
LASAIAAARPKPELAPVMTAVGFCCSLGTSVLAAERAPEVTAGAAATAWATTEVREGAGTEDTATEGLSDLRAAEAEAEEAEAATTLLVVGAAQAENDCEIDAPRREEDMVEPRVATEEEKVCIVGSREKEEGRKEGKGKERKANWKK